MKTLLSTSVTALVAGIALSSSQIATAETGTKVARLGDSVTVGCTLPGGLNGSRVYSLDIDDLSNADIKVPIDLGDTCQKALNNLTPKTSSGILFDVLQTNCGVSQSLGTQGNFIGVWQAAGQSPNNSLAAISNTAGATGTIINALVTQQLAPPGPAQPVLLAPPNAQSDYALVSYSFVCALPTGTLTYLLIAQDLQPGI
jgi:hypothetical protein